MHRLPVLVPWHGSRRRVPPPDGDPALRPQEVRPGCKQAVGTLDQQHGCGTNRSIPLLTSPPRVAVKRTCGLAGVFVRRKGLETEKVAQIAGEQCEAWCVTMGFGRLPPPPCSKAVFVEHPRAVALVISDCVFLKECASTVNLLRLAVRQFSWSTLALLLL
jgi:hypothetical protein